VDVKLGSAAISPFSGSGQLTKLIVGNPAGYNAPSSIKVGDVKVAVAIGSIFSDVIRIDSVNIQAPEITVEGGLSGINLNDIKKNLAAPADATRTAAGKTTATSGKKFAVKDIVIEGGKITVALNNLGGKSMTLPLPPIHLQNVGTDTMGVTAQELVTQILEPIITSSVEAAVKSAGNLGGTVENLGKGAGDQLKNVGGGIKNLFGK
jgi:uncharacterized protein involved in outer membrane biogenesis